MTGVESSPELSPDARPLIEEVVSLLLVMAERLQQHAGVRAAKLGLTAVQAKILVGLEDGETVPMRTLAARLNVDASNLTGLVDRLEARGAIERRPDPNDRRIRRVVITETGLHLREDFRRRLFDYTDSFGPLTVAQLRDLRDLLRRALAKEER